LGSVPQNPSIPSELEENSSSGNEQDAAEDRENYFPLSHPHFSDI
jgi:hypothetical protein